MWDMAVRIGALEEPSGLVWYAISSRACSSAGSSSPSQV
jgi:hypothetical protein